MLSSQPVPMAANGVVVPPLELAVAGSPPPISISSPRAGFATPQRLRSSSVGAMTRQGSTASTVPVTNSPRSAQLANPLISTTQVLTGASQMAYPLTGTTQVGIVQQLESPLIGTSYVKVREVKDRVSYVVDPPVHLYRDTLDGFIRSMQAELAALRHAIYEERESRNPKKWSIHGEREARKAVDSKIGQLSDALQACKKKLVSYHSLPTHDVRKALERIEGRGNVNVDITNEPGEVHLVRPLLFQRRTAGDPPTAEFAQPELARIICEDIADVAKLFDCSVIVEGHTKGGEGDFWQALANNRARAAAEKIASFGVSTDKLSCQGFPGKLGVNNSCVIIRLGIPNLSRHPVQVMPQVVVEPKVVEKVVVETPVFIEGIGSQGEGVYVESKPLLSSTPSIVTTGTSTMYPCVGSTQIPVFTSCNPSPSVSRTLSQSTIPRVGEVGMRPLSDDRVISSPRPGPSRSMSRGKKV